MMRIDENGRYVADDTYSGAEITEAMALSITPTLEDRVEALESVVAEIERTKK